MQWITRERSTTSMVCSIGLPLNGINCENRGVNRGVYLRKLSTGVLEESLSAFTTEGIRSGGRQKTSDYNAISDNYLSATVVSFQKKDCGSHFVPYSSCTSYFRFIYDRVEGRVCLPFSLLVFSSLFSQYPQPRRLMVTSHTRSPLGCAPGFTLTPGILSFVLLCTHRAPGSSCPVCFRKLR